jgi:hypothetical protein
MSSEFASTDGPEVPSDLLIDLNDCSLDGAISLTERIYGEEYLTKEVCNGRIGVMQTHDGFNVVFYENTFQHAFFKSKERNRYPDDKSVFDLERASRIRWISRLIQCRFQSVECWERPRDGQYLADRRLYIFWEGSYIVWLVKRTRQDVTDFKFETAYCAPRDYLKAQIRYCRKKNTP